VRLAWAGTIFFSGYDLRCVFCPKTDSSWQVRGELGHAGRLAEMMLELQAIGCRNINLVTPEHAGPQILEAPPLAYTWGLERIRGFAGGTSSRPHPRTRARSSYWL
jgi:putative pyruvate formate lyase activating enzyme